jgi:hypothetical protein
MGTGLHSLATIASLAPFVGIFGTVWTFPNAFGPPFNGNDARARALAFMFDHFATSMWFTAFGLLVGLMSLWFYRYLTGRLHTFDLEMESASLDLLNQLSRFRGRFTIGPIIDSPGPMFGEKTLDEVRKEGKFERRCMALAGTALVLAWLAQAWRYLAVDFISVSSAVVAACIYLPIVFAISCLPVYLVWSKLLRRRPGGLVAMGAILCLCWSVAELVLGRHLP